MVENWAAKLVEMAGLDPARWSVLGVVAIKLAIIATVFLPIVSVWVMFAIWWERKTAGHIQSRVGPLLVGPFGLLQSVADGVKLLQKEDLIPAGADHWMFRLAPYLAFAPVFTALLALPLGPQWVFESALNIGVVYLLAMLSVEVMGVILAGWGSNSKWSVYGAMREACQMVSYEIPLGLSILCGVLAAGTLNLVELSYLQGGGVWDWFVFHNPFLMGAFVLYFIASLASNKRAPFDLPESESELVAGFHTEYSGIRWSFFFFAEYSAMLVVGVIQALLFLGGWNSPLGGWDPVYRWVGYDPVSAGLAYAGGSVSAAGTWGEAAAAMGVSAAGLVVLNLYCAFWVASKAMFIVFVQIWLRWTLPRIRIDQVLAVCVKSLLPASLVCLVGTMAWVWLVPGPGPGPGAGAGGAMTAEAFAPWGGALPGVGARWATLAGSTPTLQAATQAVLTLIGVAVLAAMGWVVMWARVHRSTQPRKTLFAGVMPVGREVAFTRTAAAVVEEQSGKAAGSSEPV